MDLSRTLAMGSSREELQLPLWSHALRRFDKLAARAHRHCRAVSQDQHSTPPSRVWSRHCWTLSWSANSELLDSKGEARYFSADLGTRLFFNVEPSDVFICFSVIFFFRISARFRRRSSKSKLAAKCSGIQERSRISCSSRLGFPLQNSRN